MRVEVLLPRSATEFPHTNLDKDLCLALKDKFRLIDQRFSEEVETTTQELFALARYNRRPMPFDAIVSGFKRALDHLVIELQEKYGHSSQLKHAECRFKLIKDKALSSTAIKNSRAKNQSIRKQSSLFCILMQKLKPTNDGKESALIKNESSGKKNILNFWKHYHGKQKDRTVDRIEQIDSWHHRRDQAIAANK